ncbi:Intradiol ring-cleavage dioxygenase [Aspergillus sergii]|uniref:Intradiol ring-cleavage dioxygenase n=1 Tax=Aspergillus sergii TaxID=1034303 RepID=A0A5N6WMP7_9EURO|nr:Intradiol ring-cleavage dioxygenase [Aspergillus sergii]
MHLSSTLLTLALMATAMAHAGPHDILSRSEISRRSAMGLKCRENVSQYRERRWKRNIDRRWHGHNTTFSVHTEAPYFETIQNDTCVLTPEVTQGPYVYPPSQTLRQDMTEDQPGVPLWLDIGVLDMATCEPLEDVLIDMWHCNATGSYSSFTHLSPNTPFVELLNELGVNESDYKIGITDLHTDNTTFLRGMWPTDKHGMMEMKTIFPGFYVERAIHIHVQVHTDWTLRENGTIVTGNVVSTGQLYFDETLEEKIMSLEPYASHTQINRTTNAEDSVFPYDTAGGFSPVVDIVPMDGKDVTKGMIGYITLGVDTSAVEHGDNYLGDY